MPPMTMTLTDRLAARAMALAIDAFDDDVAIAELRGLVVADEEALEQAIRPVSPQSANLATCHRAIELLARIPHEDDAPRLASSGRAPGESL